MGSDLFCEETPLCTELSPAELRAVSSSGRTPHLSTAGTLRRICRSPFFQAAPLHCPQLCLQASFCGISVFTQLFLYKEVIKLNWSSGRMRTREQPEPFLQRSGHSLFCSSDSKGALSAVLEGARLHLYQSPSKL